MAKLPSFCFTPSLTKLIAAFLFDRSISAIVDGATSSSFSVSSGVPQVSVLSPNLFLLLINDLLASPTSFIPAITRSAPHKSSSFSTQLSYALHSQSRDAISTTTNSDLEHILCWGRDNLVNFNSTKTQLLPISLSADPSDFDIIFDNSVIRPLNSTNILGVRIASDLSWRNHIVQIVKSASKKLGVFFPM